MSRVWIASGLIAAVVAGAVILQAPATVDTWPPYEQHKQPGSRPGAPYDRQQFHLAKRLAEGQSQLPMDAYRAARDHRKSMPRRGLAKAGSVAAWEWLGPGNIGGRTRALIFHPDNPRVVFAAGVSGGIWKSTSGGASWTPIADDLSSINVGALAVSPAKPDVIYAGTGELYRRTSRPYSSMTGAGIFRSSDGGNSWRQLAPTVTDDFQYVSDIVISPNNPDRFYAATNSGVWRSDDAGVTFARILDPSASGDVRFEGCNDLSLRTDLAVDHLLVSCASRSMDDRYFLPGLLPNACDGRPCAARVYLNRDAGATSSFEVVLTEPGMGRTEMAIHKANQDIMYASSASIVPGPDIDGNGTGDYDNGLHAVFRSDDGGASWRATVRNTDPELLNTTLFSYADGFMGAVCDQSPFIYSAGWYNQAIAVNPIDPDVVWVAGMEMYRSDDGGRSWGLGSFWDGFRDGVPTSYLHADIHGIHYDPGYNGDDNTRLIVTNDGGVYQTGNDLRPTTRGPAAACNPRSDGVAWQSLNGNYGVTQFYTGAVTADGNKYIGGTQDNGTVIARSFTSPNAWEAILGGDGGHLAIDPDNPQIMFASYQNANILRTVDGGQNWARADSGLIDQFIFIAPFIMDPNQSDRLWAGGTRLWRTDNGGRGWNAASVKLGNTYDDRINAVAVSTGPVNRVAFGNKKAIYIAESALEGNGAGPLVESTPRTGWISSLRFDPDDEAVLYATYSTFGGNHVWRSADAGRNWEAIDGTGLGALPDVPVHAIAINPTDPDNLFVGTDLGVFSTVDGGTNWAVENGGFATAITEALAVSGGANPSLFAFTYGRGVWKVPLSDLDGASSYAIDGATSGLWYNADQGGHGLQLEALPGDRVFISWYAYRDGKPVWISGVGKRQGNRASVEVITATGGGLPPDFDADAVERTPWGTLTLEFQNAQQGALSWKSERDGYSSGQLPIERLTQLAANDAGGNLRACHSGAWYASDQSGHGLMIQVLDGGSMGRVALTWFLSDANGDQLWLLGQGEIDANGAEIALSRFEGGEFPPSFNPVDVNRQAWGTLQLSALDDQSISVSWDGSAPGASSGDLSMVRLTQIEDLDCGR